MGEATAVACAVDSDGAALLAGALAEHRAGQLEAAEAGYRSLLVRHPDHPDGLHLLGLVAQQRGDLATAEQLVARAIAGRPDAASFQASLGNVHLLAGRYELAVERYTRSLSLAADQPETVVNLGRAHQALGQLEEAIRRYRAALALRPGLPEAWSNLGQALLEAGQLEVAGAVYQQLVQLAPEQVDGHAGLANSHKTAGRPVEALDHFRRALSLAPDRIDLLNNLASALIQLGRETEAEPLLLRALALDARVYETHYNFGLVRAALGDRDAAVEHYRCALALRPDAVEALSNLGNLLQERGERSAALGLYERAAALRPDDPLPWCNLGGVLDELARLPEAIAAFRAAIDRRPDFAEAQVGLAASLLRSGELEAGWRAYEWRWRHPRFEDARRSVAGPAWDGSPLEGARILVRAEQGLGDTLQFARFLPLVSGLGGRVTFECQPELVRLLARQGLADRVLARGEPLGGFDLQAPLLSLPRLLGTTLRNLPNRVPYLAAEPGLAAAWADRLAGISGLRVGLVWGGNPANRIDGARSLPLELLAPLGRVGGVTWLSLQKGPPADQLRTPPAGLAIRDLAPALRDFADTAALLAHLDLVVTVDTAVAHLAGALGRPVWLLLAAVADWRWLRDRTTSPWYPSARLFRQPKPADWRALAEQVGEALATWTGSYPASGAST